MKNKINLRLESRKESSLRRNLQAFDRQEGQYIYRGNERLINFSSNDYLGLSSTSFHLKKTRLGSGSSRSVTGNLKRYEEVEKLYGNYFGFEHSLFFPSGFQANIGLMMAFFDENDSIICDQRIHSSLFYGLQLSKANFKTFKHSDWSHYEKKFSYFPQKIKALIIESLYSMDGDILNTDYLENSRDQLPFLIIDEAHSLGVLGKKGKGVATHLSDVTIGTLGKAFGYHGAFVLCNQKVRDYLINFCPTFQYTTGLPPFHYEIAVELLEKIENMDAERNELKEFSSFAKNYFLSLGIPISGDAHILSIKIGNEKKSLFISDELSAKGHYLFSARYPTTPFNQAILRLGLTIHHKEKDIKELGKNLAKLIKLTQESL